MNKTVALVGCGKAKRDFRSKARNLYTSNYAKKKRDFAEVAADDWLILSAKYGLVDPDRRIPPYDVTATDVDPLGFNQMVCDQATDRFDDVFADADTTDVDEVVERARSTHSSSLSSWYEPIQYRDELPDVHSEANEGPSTGPSGMGRTQYVRVNTRYVIEDVEVETESV